MQFSKKKPRQLRKKVRRIELSLLQKQFIVGMLIACILGVLMGAIWYVSHRPSLQISEVMVIGGETIPHEEIKGTVERELVGTYFHLVPKRFLFLYPHTRIVESISNISRVKHVQVKRDGAALQVIFDEYVPYALWCKQVDAKDCLFIDAAGYAFAPAPELQGSAFARYVDEGIEPQQGATAFSREFIDSSEQFIAELEDTLSLYVTHVVRHSTYDVDYAIAGGGLIKVSQSIPIQDSFENLQSILLSDAFKHLEPGAFQYIDLRFGEKIFVNEVSAGEATTTASTSNQL
jgi:hypothetical protein